MNRWYFTFGSASVFGKCYIQVNCDSREEARQVMFENFGQKWAFDYGQDEFEDAIKRHGLIRLCVITLDRYGFYRAEKVDVTGA